MRENHHFYKIALGFVFFSLIITIVAGCAGKKSEKKDPFFEKWKIKAEQSKGFSPSARRRAVDLPEKAMEEKAKQEREAPGQERVVEPEKPLPTKKISMKMRNVELAMLLRVLARAADQNIIISEKVIGKANINIKNAPWDQVFRAILSTYRSVYTWDGDIIRVMTLAESVVSEPPVVKVIHIKYADPNTLRNNLAKFLTTGETESSSTTEDKVTITAAILVDSHTNSLMIQATKSDIERLLPVIEKLDRPARQILIEAHIVETSRQTAMELGIQWGGLYHKADGDNWTSEMDVKFPAALSEEAGFTLGYVAEEIGKSVLSVQLSALQKEGRLNILSCPSITTLDNQAAIISSGKKIPYDVPIFESGVVVGYQIQYHDVVIKLAVTPHVIDDKTLKLAIITIKDDLDWANAVGGNPALSTKSAVTTVVLFDGQTTVIGGLSKENIDDSESGVPWLKDIPLLGYLFKGTNRSNSMEDVLIFITPHILKQEMVE